MFSCIIVDDEPLANELLTDYIKRHKDLNFKQSFSNPIQALQYVNEDIVDLIFLDVQMPELSGIQFMKIVSDKCQIILTTAYDSYAVEGFDYNAVDYLLKPITFERFSRSIEKVKKQHSPLPARAKKNLNDVIFVKTEYKTVKILLSDIYAIEGLGDYVAIHLESKKILTLDTMKNYSQLLPEPYFVRVHKSYIVAIGKIDFIERNEINIKSLTVPVGNTYKKRFWELING